MRKFTQESPITKCFEFKTSPLIKIDAERNITHYNSKREKIEALTSRKKTDKFIIAWRGEYSTDVFEVSEDDIALALVTFM